MSHLLERGERLSPDSSAWGVFRDKMGELLLQIKELPEEPIIFGI